MGNGGVPVRPAAPADEAAPRVPPPAETLVEWALDARPELAVARAQLAAAEKATDAASWARLPQVSAVAAYMHNEGVVFAELDSAYVGATLDWNIWSWGARNHQLDSIRAQATQARAQADAAETQARVDVQARVLALRAAGAAYEVSAANIAQAEASLRAQERRQAAGAGTMSDSARRPDGARTRTIDPGDGALRRAARGDRTRARGRQGPMGNGRDAMSEDNPAKVADASVAVPAAPVETAPRRKLFPRFAAVAAVIAVGVGGYVAWRHAQGVSTDDAFVRADIVQVPAEVAGRVTEVVAKENAHVARGDLLLRLDDSEYRLKVAQAQAALAAAEADARRAQEASQASRSDIESAQLRLKDAKREAKLQTDLAGGGASVQSAVDRASNTATVAAQTVSSAQASLDANVAAVEAARARVPAAQAALDLAARDLSLTEIRAPADGIASRIELQPGELVQKGQPLLAVVPDERFVVANFKETDLDRIAVGARVRVEVDAYPDLDLVGSVESVAAGTGATFTLLPADNATGNFIKVVQRVPVRIALDSAPRIPAGLSATVRVERQ